MSEPATQALLLARVATPEEIAADEEITTAHARPVARSIEPVQPATSQALSGRIRFGNPLDAFGLAALALFGVGLIGLGGWTLLDSAHDSTDVMAATALTIPGLAAITLASLAYSRRPAPRRA